MGSFNTNKCDKCGKEARNDTQKDLYDTGFKNIKISIGGYENHSYNYKNDKCYIFLCEECLKKIGIVRIEKEDANDDRPSIADKLYDIVAEIVHDLNQAG